jgi:zinc transport system permease protein
MKTLEYLFDPVLGPLYWPGVLAGLAIAIVCGALSGLVVVKRLAFIGQGISHAAFGGIGLAAILGLTARLTREGLVDAPAGGIPQLIVVAAFCVGSGLLVGAVADRRATREDTAIGIVLVASMAIGAILLSWAGTGLAWESFLFGTLYNVPLGEAVAALALAPAMLLVLWAIRRPLLFWAFDEPVAATLGIPARAMKLALLVLLALATVVAMRLAGVVLATAMLVLPGAVALRLSRRLWTVVALSLTTGLVGVAAGVIASFEMDVAPGPAIVTVLALAFAAVRALTSSADRN